MRQLEADGVRDRAGAVRWLARRPVQQELTGGDVLAVLDHYPVAQWDAGTSEACLRLLDETTPGGLPALLEAMPEVFYVAADIP